MTKWKPSLPLRDAYVFLRSKNLAQEAERIRLTNPGMGDNNAHMKRGMILEVLRSGGLVDDFCYKYWPRGTTAEGREKIDSYLNYYRTNGGGRTREQALDTQLLLKERDEIEARMAALDEFNPSNEAEGRQWTLCSIVCRQGQPEFRRALISLYEGRCAISGCDAVEALEAAHIVACNGPKTNHPCNGLLLRADLHTLFDLGLMAVAMPGFRVILAATLKHTAYAQYDGKTLNIPRDVAAHPGPEAFARHREAAGL